MKMLKIIKRPLTRNLKLIITGGCMFLFSIIFQTSILPTVINSELKRKLVLKEGYEMRGLWSKLPFEINFNFYIFNVTNPDEVSNGEKPVLQEIGPFIYDEWHEKTNLIDNEEDDTVSYTTKNSLFFNAKKSNGLTGEEEVIVPHYFALAMANGVLREDPSKLPIVGKAIQSILRSPKTLFIKAKIREILFDGLIIDCNVENVIGAAVCTEISSNYEKYHLKMVGENLFTLSLWGEFNATDTKERLRVRRGYENIMDVGKVVEYNNKTNISTWDDDYCDSFNGATDGTIFHPFFDESGKDNLVAYHPGLCRSINCYYDSNVVFSGMNLMRYTTDLGTDGENNPLHKCYCMEPGKCLKKGVFDIFKCTGAPLIISNPHFYMADPYYLDTVKGLKPVKDNHMIKVDLDAFTGAPIRASMKVQINMFITKVDKIKVMKNFSEALLPLIWIDEQLVLPEVFIKQIRSSHVLLSVARVFHYLLMIGGLGLCVYSGYKRYKSRHGKMVIKK